MNVTFIAEIGANHNGSLVRALNLVSTAHQCGFDAVKVQIFDRTRMFRDRICEMLPCQLDWLPILKIKAHELGMEFGATVCNVDLVEKAAEHCDFLKVGSYELLCMDIIKACAATGLPLILSTGMASAQEIFDSELIHNNRLTLLHCVSLYPCPVQLANLQRIDQIRKHRKWNSIAIGYSDHTCDWRVVWRAATHYKASPIEMHFDLDETHGPRGPERDHSWLDNEAADVISLCKSEGDGSDCPSSEEQQERKFRRDPVTGLRGSA